MLSIMVAMKYSWKKTTTEARKSTKLDSPSADYKQARTLYTSKL
jgi:hypothetical protein